MAFENGSTKSHRTTNSTPKIDLVIDLQFGSTGKGLICGYLGESGNYDTCISANMPNAGHTYINKFGTKYIFKVLPSSAVCPDIKQVLIGPGAVFSVDRLLAEMMNLRPDQTLRIHPNATVLSEGHVGKEQKLTHIASTRQGSAAALIEKMERSSDITAKQLLKDTEIGNLVASHSEWKIRLESATGILAEGSQGYSLGINTQFYPYTTSRDCTPAAFLSNMGVPLGMLNHVIGTCRTLPIRVGGTSGDCYPDQEELDWEKDLDIKPERTTVTNRIRRIFTYSQDQIEAACWWCEPDLVFVNFANYVSKDYMTKIVAHIDQMSTVRWVGFGPAYKDIGVV